MLCYSGVALEGLSSMLAAILATIVFVIRVVGFLCWGCVNESSIKLINTINKQIEG